MLLQGLDARRANSLRSSKAREEKERGEDKEKTTGLVTPVYQWVEGWGSHRAREREQQGKEDFFFLAFL